MPRSIESGIRLEGVAALVGCRCSLFLSRGEGVGAAKGRGRQDKGNASGHCLIHCLHDFFYGGMGRLGEAILLTICWPKRRAGDG